MAKPISYLRGLFSTSCFAVLRLWWRVKHSIGSWLSISYTKHTYRMGLVQWNLVLTCTDFVNLSVNKTIRWVCLSVKGWINFAKWFGLVQCQSPIFVHTVVRHSLWCSSLLKRTSFPKSAPLICNFQTDVSVTNKVISKQEWEEAGTDEGAIKLISIIHSTFLLSTRKSFCEKVSWDQVLGEWSRGHRNSFGWTHFGKCFVSKCQKYEKKLYGSSSNFSLGRSHVWNIYKFSVVHVFSWIKNLL